MPIPLVLFTLHRIGSHFLQVPLIVLRFLCVQDVEIDQFD